MDQYIGKMLDNRYEIIECIGVGGMAVVYKTRDHRLNRLVAVKILKPELASDADFRRRFHDESQAVAMLSHANIVSVYDVSRSDGLDYIVMELVDGMTLKQYMQRRGTPLNWREAQHFITQIMRALGHAHSRGIIHRDIKPHNIMVLRDGSVKVTDFGIAQLASAAQNTMTQEAIGSVHYISPEQAKGSHVDCRTDIYSAGVVLYELLTGRLPFEGDTPVAVAIQHIKSIPASPRDLNPDVPRALEAITLKAMAPELGQRYATAEEMLEDLKEFRKNPDYQPAAPNPEDEPDEPTMVVPTKVITASVRVPVERREPEAVQPERRERRRREVEEDDDYDDEPPSRGGGFAAAAVAVVLILAFIGCIVYFLWNFFGKDLLTPQVQEYEVPKLLGYTVEQLEQNKTVLGDFTLVVGDVKYSAEYPENQICEQVPTAGTVVRDGTTTITVTISGGEEKTYMPAVEGSDYRQALDKLQNEMGLKVRQEEDYSPTITEGFVISQIPSEGIWVVPGDEVTIVVSKGPEQKQATVINFLNVPLEQAKEQITQLGLKEGEVKEYYSDEYAEGRVMWQSVNPGDQVDKDSAIDLWVSLGLEPVETPEPSDEPSEPPVESPPVAEPTQDVSATTGTKPITVDLSAYEGSVDVRIVVGDVTIHDAPVDANQNMSFTKNAVASGVQWVSIYIDGMLVDNYPLDFSA